MSATAGDLRCQLLYFLSSAGERGECGKCGAGVRWLRNRGFQSNSQAAAMDDDGRDHAAGCTAKAPETAEEWLATLNAALSACGDTARCKGCGQRIWWVVHPQTSAKCPYDPDGRAHFVTCPKAGEFRRRRV